MDEASALLGPHEPCVRVHITLDVTARGRAALGVPLAGVVGVEHPLSRLLVHHLPVLQQARQVAHRHRQFLGYLRRCQATHAVEHLVAVLRLRFQCLDLVVQRLDLLAMDRVGTRLTDQRQHLRGHPALEGLRLFQLLGEDQGVETALVDDHSSGLIGRIANRDGAPIFLVYMLNNSIGGILVPQCLGHVFTHEESLSAVVRHRPDLSEHLMIESS